MQPNRNGPAVLLSRNGGRGVELVTIWTALSTIEAVEAGDAVWVG